MISLHFVMEHMILSLDGYTGKHLKFTDFLNFSKFITMMKLLFFVIFNFRLVKNKKSKLICCFHL